MVSLDGSRRSQIHTSEERDLFLSFFNNCSVTELSLMSGSSVKVAEKICSLVPFVSINDLNSKIKNLDIVADNFIENCHDVLNMRMMFSKLMVKCEKLVARIECLIGKQLGNNIMELPPSESDSKNLISESPKSLNQRLSYPNLPPIDRILSPVSN